MQPSGIRRQTCAVMLLLAGLIVACGSSHDGAGLNSVPSGWPVARRSATVSSVWGAHRHGSHHQGVDLTAPRGTSVVATAAGVVTFAGRSGDWGRLVIIDHGDGWKTYYAHLHRIRVRRGQDLRRGSTIGTVGRSGNATGPHLHYEIRRHGHPIDPRPSLGG